LDPYKAHLIVCDGSISNSQGNVEYMVATIKEHMAPGEKGLVICKKIFLDNKRVPQWLSRHQRFENPKLFAEEYGWNIDGRKLCVINWGTGIGSNLWKDANVVLLFDDYRFPRRIAAAQVQGYWKQRADQGELATTPGRGHVTAFWSFVLMFL